MMTSLPLAWIVSVLTSIAAFALSQDTRIPFPARFFLCAFLLTLATIGLLLGLRLSFSTTWAAQLQPLIAVMVAPSAYLGFVALTQNGWNRVAKIAACEWSSSCLGPNRDHLRHPSFGRCVRLGYYQYLPFSCGTAVALQLG